MNFLSYKECPEEGDTVIVYLSFANIYALKLVRGEVFQTKYGALKHDVVIGKQYGSKVDCSRGYVYILFPTPELWTLTLPHRTQILYSRDISFVTLQLDLKPGSIVCEAGTGSGSMTHALARTIGPSGHVHTFDFHEHRAELARREFEEHAMTKVVTASHRDVCEDGFGLQDVADAVFLDLPHPWKVIESAVKAFKATSGGRLCSFSPCMEQVQRTCQALQSHGFVDITTYECLERPFEVKRVALQDALGNSASKVSRKKRKAKSDENVSDVGAATEADDTTQTTTGEADDGSFLAAVPSLQIPGHTGYLTFATLLAT
ncbi:tRNA (adenine(58)-N(1))-methyltransferase catalytic subunit TRMT61A-like [Ornithodoros turicata]|uniref:tRNA (adenine(58)-N(1))-methyltransferase catalytic subunit TRMT61A-like n=1 Tax=Ornithodoros turicata TaxID=34597 RepID=UPI00313A0741